MKAGRSLGMIVCWLLLEIVLGISTTQGEVIALKRDAGLTAGGAVDPRFAEAVVVTTTVSDAGLWNTTTARWRNIGAAPIPLAHFNLYKFDLSAIPPGSTIHLAQLRIYHTMGNGELGWGGVGPILTHDWIEGGGAGTWGVFPGTAGGVSVAHPIGYNTAENRNADNGTAEPWQSWGVTSDQFFSMAGDVGPVPLPTSKPSGKAFHVCDVTEDVQNWVNRSRPNYGWAQVRGNWDFHLSEIGSQYQPVLFVDYTPSTFDAVAPAAITDLAVSDPTSLSITLTWTAPGDDDTTGTATTYDIRYSGNPITDDASWDSATPCTGEPAPLVAGTVQSMTIVPLNSETTYYFAIRAADEWGNLSGLSNSPVGATLADSGGATAPAAITDLAAGEPTSDSIKLTWTAPGDDGHIGTAASYDIRYSMDPIDESSWDSATPASGAPAPAASGTVQSMTVGGLSDDTTYYFAIRTSDDVPNTSALSNVAAGTTLRLGDFTAPAAITTLAVDKSKSGGTSLRLTWKASGDDGSTGTASGYDLRYSSSPIDETSWDSATPCTYGVPSPGEAGTTQAAVVMYLNMSTRYYFAIKTVDEAGNWSSLSNVATDTTWSHSDIVSPAKITDLAVSDLTSDSATLTWTAVGDDGVFGTAVSYDVRYSTSPITDDSWFWTATKVTGEPTPQAYGAGETMTVTGLNAGTTYYFAVRAVDEEMNWSVLSNMPAVTTVAADDTTAPAVVGDLAAAHPSSRSIRLTWTAPGDDGASGTAASYDIRYSTSSISEANWADARQAESQPVPQVAGTSQSWVVQGLLPGTTYHFAMRTIDEAGNASDLSNVATGTTLPLSELNKTVLSQQDFEYLGAFMLPRSVGGRTTAYSLAGIALRRVDGDLRIFGQTTTVETQTIYECTFPGWGQSPGNWPQATVIYDWGSSIYGSAIPALHNVVYYNHGMVYDAAAGRFYFSWGYHYNVDGSNDPSLAWTELVPGAPVVHGPWKANPATAHSQRIRAGGTIIPDWFADAYVGGRRLGLGHGGYYSGASTCSQGPYLAATVPPTDQTSELDTITLIDYPTAHRGTHHADYWTTPADGWAANPIGGVGFWGMGDDIWGAGIWIDLPDKHGMVYMPTLGYGHIRYLSAHIERERGDVVCMVYDPKDLAAVAQGTRQPWESRPLEEWIVPLLPRIQRPHMVGEPIITGLAFDAESRTLFAVSPHSYQSGVDWYPLVHGWRIKESLQLEGDIDGDGEVSVLDIVAVVTRFGLTPADPDWNDVCDFDGDSEISVLDIVFVVTRFGNTL